MATREYTLRVPAHMEAFEQAAAALRSALDDCLVTGRARYHAELVFEEVVTNVIRHGYGGPPSGEHTIEVRLRCGAGTIELVVEDDGRAFNPLQRPDPERPASLDTAPLGGLGIVLVRKIATTLGYERTPDRRNRLTVTIPAA